MSFWLESRSSQERSTKVNKTSQFRRRVHLGPRYAQLRLMCPGRRPIQPAPCLARNAVESVLRAVQAARDHDSTPWRSDGQKRYRSQLTRYGGPPTRLSVERRVWQRVRLLPAIRRDTATVCGEWVGRGLLQSSPALTRTGEVGRSPCQSMKFIDSPMNLASRRPQAPPRCLAMISSA